ncbi:serine protease inhibitor 42Dd isoform X1 [Drosophila mauritiana]|uniref:Serine protease inhibitor 42Dd isoform X1 n=1 Tax=Drosophila mauritiana TaxID=7226 RepID=A0A6P8K1E0_DROMA|nr:serine protease inhibitor 42Dd isoform X1 [Drosophila mauritiana]
MQGNSNIQFLVLLLIATSVLGKFKLNLLEMVMDKAESNFIASPLCIEIGMSMILMGAKGTTAEELRSILDLPVDMTELVKKYERIMSNLQQHNGLHFANRLYVSETYEVRQDYNALLTSTFMKVANDNLGQRKASNSISFAVQRKSHRGMRTISNYHDLQINESAVLVNTVYYRGAWKTMFSKKGTKLKVFYGDHNREAYVRMMSHVGRFRIADHSYGQIIELPFDNSNLSMIIGLPLHNTYLSSIEKILRTLSESLVEKDVHVELPKFKIKYQTELVEPLRKLGIHLIFSNTSDLSGLLTNGKGAKINNVLHKSFIEIDERGASTGEAAEHVEYIQKKTGASASFKVNRPFAFLIRDKHTVFFRGRVVRLPNELHL